MGPEIVFAREDGILENDESALLMLGAREEKGKSEAMELRLAEEAAASDNCSWRDPLQAMRARSISSVT
jgi:hypothetical protein